MSVAVDFITVQWLPQTVKFISLTIIIARSGLTHTHTHKHHKHTHTTNTYTHTSQTHPTMKIADF